MAIFVQVLAGVLLARMNARIRRETAGRDRGQSYAVVVLLLAALAMACLVSLLLAARTAVVVNKACAKAGSRC